MSPETTFHSTNLRPSDGAQQVLRLDTCRRWVSISAECGDLAVEVATKKGADGTAWARLPAEELFNFWLEPGQELWMRVRTVDVWGGEILVDPEEAPEVAESVAWISMVVCRDAA